MKCKEIIYTFEGREDFRLFMKFLSPKRFTYVDSAGDPERGQLFYEDKEVAWYSEVHNPTRLHVYPDSSPLIIAIEKYLS